MTPEDEIRKAAATLRRVSYVDFAIRVGEPDYDAFGLGGHDLEPLAVVLDAYVGLAERAGWIDGQCGFSDVQAALDFSRRINQAGK